MELVSPPPISANPFSSRMFVVAMITPVAIDDIGYRYYIVYAVIGGIIPPIIYLFYPETKGRSLEEVDEIFRDAPSIFAAVSMSKHLPVGDRILERVMEEKATVEEIE